MSWWVGAPRERWTEQAMARLPLMRTGRFFALHALTKGVNVPSPLDHPRKPREEASSDLSL